MFDHPNGGFVDRIRTSDYGLHRLSASFQNGYEFETPGAFDDGLLAVVASEPLPFTVTGPFVGGTVATFGGAVGDALLVYVAGGQLFVVGARNVMVS